MLFTNYFAWGIEELRMIPTRFPSQNCTNFPTRTAHVSLAEYIILQRCQPKQHKFQITTTKAFPTTQDSLALENFEKISHPGLKSFSVKSHIYATHFQANGMSLVVSHLVVVVADVFDRHLLAGTLRAIDSHVQDVATCVNINGHQWRNISDVTSHSAPRTIGGLLSDHRI